MRGHFIGQCCFDLNNQILLQMHVFGFGCVSLLFFAANSCWVMSLVTMLPISRLQNHDAPCKDVPIIQQILGRLPHTQLSLFITPITRVYGGYIYSILQLMGIINHQQASRVPPRIMIAFPSLPEMRKSHDDLPIRLWMQRLVKQLGLTSQMWHDIDLDLNSTGHFKYHHISTPRNSCCKVITWFCKKIWIIEKIMGEKLFSLSGCGTQRGSRLNPH